MRMVIRVFPFLAETTAPRFHLVKLYSFFILLLIHLYVARNSYLHVGSIIKSRKIKNPRLREGLPCQEMIGDHLPMDYLQIQDPLQYYLQVQEAGINGLLQTYCCPGGHWPAFLGYVHVPSGTVNVWQLNLSG